MEYELALYFSDSIKKIPEMVFVAEKHRFKSVVVEPFQIKYTTEYLSGCKLSIMIDAPRGSNSFNGRVASVLESIRKGAKIIDLTINSRLISEEIYEPILVEIKAMLEICKVKTCLRLVVEPGQSTDNQILKFLVKAQKAGADHVVLGSGLYLLDITDNLILCNQITSNLGYKVYLTGPYTSEHIDLAKKSLAHGVRFLNNQVVTKLFSV